VAPKIRSMVVGVNAVRERDRVLVRAVELADRLDVALHVVHGYMLNDPLLDAYTKAGYLGESTIVDFGRELESSLSAQVRNLTDRADVRIHVVAGPPVAAILDVTEAVGADLILVGSSAHAAFPYSLLGSTCRAIIRRASVPVLMIRPEQPVVPRRILAATDLSAVSRAAFRWSRALDAAAGAKPEVRALLVVSDALLMLPLEQRLLDRVADQELAGFLAGVEDGDEADRIVRTGDPATEILEEARLWGADLIVLGTHCRRGMDRFFLGSVAERCLRGATVNVMIVSAAVASLAEPGQAQASADPAPQSAS
jgi:nucleotide-binding universal stress UspA family protein